MTRVCSRVAQFTPNRKWLLDLNEKNEPKLKEICFIREQIR